MSMHLTIAERIVTITALETEIERNNRVLENAADNDKAAVLARGAVLAAALNKFRAARAARELRVHCARAGALL